MNDMIKEYEKLSVQYEKLGDGMRAQDMMRRAIRYRIKDIFFTHCGVRDERIQRIKDRTIIIDQKTGNINLEYNPCQYTLYAFPRTRNNPNCR